MSETIEETAGIYKVEPLDKHNRAAFSCGVDALDRYFEHQASQDTKRGASRVYVAVLETNGPVCGYYTLTNTQIETPRFPQTMHKKLPRYPYSPAVLLGRLAVDTRHQGKGLGEFLLMDAFMISIIARSLIASVALVVDAKDAKAKAFYERYGFKSFDDKELQLFMTLDEAQKAFFDDLIPIMKKEHIEWIDRNGMNGVRKLA